jgi:hypothetical protein
VRPGYVEMEVEAEDGGRALGKGDEMGEDSDGENIAEGVAEDDI